MTEFEYQRAEKNNDDPITVMARAIRAHFKDSEEKITPQLSRVVAQIIDDGFLNGVIGEQANLVTLAKKELTWLEEECIKANRKRWAEFREADEWIRKANTAKDEITAINKLREQEEQETDPRLLGAKKAYRFILQETNDKDKASKAYDSYLNGPRICAAKEK